MFHRSIFTSFSLLLFSSTLQAAPDLHLKMNLAQEDYAARDYLYQQVTAAMRYSKIISQRSVINLNADLYHRRYPDISSRDSDSLLLDFIYNQVPTAGFRDPMYSILLRHEASDSPYLIDDFAQATAYTDNADTRRLCTHLNESSSNIRKIITNFGTNDSINTRYSFDLSYQSVKYDINVNDSSYNLVSLDYFYKV